MGVYFPKKPIEWTELTTDDLSSHHFWLLWCILNEWGWRKTIILSNKATEWITKEMETRFVKTFGTAI